MTIKIVIRSPDEPDDEGSLISLPENTEYWESLLSGSLHSDIKLIALDLYPSGAIIDSFANMELEEAYETDIRILH